MCVYYLMKISNRVGRSIFFFYLRRFSESRSSSGSTPSVRSSVRPSVHPSETLQGAKFVLSVTPKVFILFYSNFAYDCSHIEDVHLLFCARFINFFSFLRVVELGHFLASSMLRG